MGIARGGPEANSKATACLRCLSWPRCLIHIFTGAHQRRRLFLFFLILFFLPTGAASGAEQKADYSLARSKFPLIIWHSARLCAKPPSARRWTHRNTVAGVAQLCSFGWVTEIDFFLLLFFNQSICVGAGNLRMWVSPALIYNNALCLQLLLCCCCLAFFFHFKEQQLHWCDYKKSVALNKCKLSVFLKDKHFIQRKTTTVDCFEPTVRIPCFNTATRHRWLKAISRSALQTPNMLCGLMESHNHQ